MLSRDFTNETFRTLTRIEIINAVLGAAMVGLLVACCWLLDRNHRQLAELRTQMQLRNDQGRQAVVLLDEAVQRLQAPLPVRSMPPAPAPTVKPQPR